MTRENILRSAGTVFSSRTYSQATLSDVLQEAGVTQGALYFHFDSKLNLALEVIRRQHERSLAASDGLVGSDRSAVEALIVLSGRLIAQIRDEPLVRAGLRLTTESPDIFPDHLHGPYTDWIQTGRILLAQAVGAQEIDINLDIDEAAHFIIGTFTGVQSLSRALTDSKDLLPRIEEMWRFVLRGLDSRIVLTPTQIFSLLAADATRENP